MAGKYTDIVEIRAPATAVPGETVSVSATVKNTWTTPVHVYCVGVWDSEKRFIDWLDAWIAPGESRIFEGSLVMPSRNVTLNIYTYYEAIDGFLYSDDSKSKTVKVGELIPEFAGFGITEYVKS